MSILDFSAGERAPARGNLRLPFGGLQNQQDRPKAKVWLNIGYEAGGKFINLPVGLPIDTMEPAPVNGQNVDWVKQRTAQNALLDMLKKLGVELEPGQEQTIALQVRVRRVNEELAVEPAENEYTLDPAMLLVANG